MIYSTTAGTYTYIPKPIINQGHSSEIGALQTVSGSSTSVATSTETNMCSITLQPGSWVIRGYISFGTNTAGDRIAYLSTTSGSTSGYDLRVSAANGNTRIQTINFFKITSATTYYLVGWQNSGSAITATGYIRAMRIA